MRKFRLNDIVQRREFTSPGPDPTVIVEWTITLPHGSITTREFQGVIQAHHQLTNVGTHELTETAAEALHNAFEIQYAEHQAEEHGDTYAAWRAAAEDGATRIEKLGQALGNLIVAHAKTCDGCDLCNGARELMEEK